MEDLQFVPNLSKSQAFDIENGRPYKNRDALKKVIENTTFGTQDSATSTRRYPGKV